MHNHEKKLAFGLRPIALDRNFWFITQFLRNIMLVPSFQQFAGRYFQSFG